MKRGLIFSVVLLLFLSMFVGCSFQNTIRERFANGGPTGMVVLDDIEQVELIDDIVGALAKHSKEHVKDFRSRWRYAMILWHCCEDFDAASNEFKEMSEQCDPLPSYEAYVDAALFFQNHNHFQWL